MVVPGAAHGRDSPKTNKKDPVGSRLPTCTVSFPRTAPGCRGAQPLIDPSALDEQVGIPVVGGMACVPALDVAIEPEGTVGLEAATMVVKGGRVLATHEPAVHAGIKDLLLEPA